MLQNQSNISAGGHVAARDVLVTNNTFLQQSAKTYIELLYEKFNVECSDINAPVANGIVEDLQHFLDRPASQLTRSLKEKLVASGRVDMVEYAEEAKERAMKRILRFQSSPSAQEIFIYVLGDLRTRFHSHVSPLISSGAARTDVDAALYKSVLSPVASVMVPSTLGLSLDLVVAFLYYLAGNCHIQWD